MTSAMISLTADDGHEFEAWVARPVGEPRAGLVILQEIFGITAHIQAVAAEFAAQGYLAVAPAMFDRVERGAVLGYDDFTSARETMGKGPWLCPEQKVLLETDAKKAREIGRAAMAVYLRAPNYQNNLRQFGFGDADFENNGSDRLVDAIVAWGG